jgi:hypothetical protein
MGRRNKDDEVQRLEQTVRDQKAIIRSLQKRLKKLNRGYKRERDTDKKPKEKEEPELPAKKLCPDCGKGEEIERIVLNKRWLECSICDRRTKTKEI